MKGLLEGFGGVTDQENDQNRVRAQFLAVKAQKNWMIVHFRHKFTISMILWQRKIRKFLLQFLENLSIKNQLKLNLGGSN